MSTIKDYVERFLDPLADAAQRWREDRIQAEIQFETDCRKADDKLVAALRSLGITDLTADLTDSVPAVMPVYAMLPEEPAPPTAEILPAVDLPAAPEPTPKDGEIGGTGEETPAPTGFIRYEEEEAPSGCPECGAPGWAKVCRGCRGRLGAAARAASIAARKTERAPVIEAAKTGKAREWAVSAAPAPVVVPPPPTLEAPGDTQPDPWDLLDQRQKKFALAEMAAGINIYREHLSFWLAQSSAASSEFVATKDDPSAAEFRQKYVKIARIIRRGREWYREVIGGEPVLVGRS